MEEQTQADDCFVQHVASHVFNAVIASAVKDAAAAAVKHALNARSFAAGIIVSAVSASALYDHLPFAAMSNACSASSLRHVVPGRAFAE
jgi:hypothetical protein